MKKILKVLVVLVLFVLAVILLSPLWIGPVACSVANSIVPQKTGTAFRLGEFGLNGYTGRLLVGDLQLENPEGCEQRMAVTLGRFDVDLEMASLMSDTIVIEHVELKDLFVSYVNDNKGRNNFEVILANAMRKPEAAEQKADAAQKPAEGKSDKPAKKVIIDRLSVSGVKVQYGKLTLPVPAFTLTGIGRASNGATFEQVWSELLGKVMQSLGVLGEGLKGLSDQAKELTGNLSEIGQQGAAQAAKSIDAIAGSASKSVDKAGEAAGKALSGAADSVNEAAGKASEAAGKAVDSLKGLFN